MRSGITSRGPMVRALLIGMLAGWSGVVFAQHVGGGMAQRPPSYAVVDGQQNANDGGQQQKPAPIERRPPAGGQPANGGGEQQQHLVGPNGRRGGEHLAEWMNQHQGMTLEQQQQALDQEPGFLELPAQTQQRMHKRLAQLNAMTPLQRQRLLEHTEAMERLTLGQRSQVREAMQRLGSLPIDQRRQVMRSFRELRQLPPNQRMVVMMSMRYSWMNTAQREALTRLIQVEPMLPEQ